MEIVRLLVELDLLHILDLGYFFLYSKYLNSFFRYSDNPGELNVQLSGWLNAASSNIGSARAIISPYLLFLFKQRFSLVNDK